MAREAEKILLHRQLCYLRMLHSVIEQRGAEVRALRCARSIPDQTNLEFQNSTPREPSERCSESERARAGSVGVAQSVSERCSESERAQASETPKRSLKWESVPDVLIKALRSPFPSVRKSAASAIGKYVQVESTSGSLEKSLAMPLVFGLARLVGEETNPQTRQYAVKALPKFGARAVFALAELKDAARDETAPHYVRTAAADAISSIQEANRTALHATHHFCSRCRRLITEDDYRQSMDRFARPYCRHCFDEVGLERRNFELKVDDAKIRRTESGIAVQSRGEKQIGEWLEAHHLNYSYDERYRIAGDVVIRPDFYLPEFDLYIEFWGMNTSAYLTNMRKKKILYQREGKRLISIYPKDLKSLDSLLSEKLSRYFRV